MSQESGEGDTRTLCRRGNHHQHGMVSSGQSGNVYFVEWRKHAGGARIDAVRHPRRTIYFRLQPDSVVLLPSRYDTVTRHRRLPKTDLMVQIQNRNAVLKAFDYMLKCDKEQATRRKIKGPIDPKRRQHLFLKP